MPALAIAAFAVCLLAILGAGRPAYAQQSAVQTRHDFDISEETLGPALAALTRQAGVQLLYPYELAQTGGMNPVTGQYTVLEALDIMFRGTDFTGGLTERGVVTITRSEGKARQVGEDQMLTPKRKRSLLASISAVLFGATGAAAQDDGANEDFAIDEIIVTATKRASTIQDVPFSINAQTGEDIRRTGSKSLEDLARNVAGLQIQNLGPGQSQVAIRGVSAGQIVRDQPGVKEQVGVYLDESVISLSLFTPDIDLYDLSRVETLRGPQGTLFGSGSIGGTIRYITNQPNLEGFEGSVELDLNTVEEGGEGGSLKAMVNIPMGDKAALRAVAYHTEYAGFIDALREGGSITKDVNDGTRTGGRIALRFEPSETVAITPRIIYQEIDMDGFNRQEVFNLFANPFTTTRPAIEFEDRQQFLLLDEGFEDETLIADLLIEASFDGVDLTSITSYTDREILVSRDASALTGSVTLSPFVPAFGFQESDALLPSNLRDTTEVEQFTQELRLSSNNDGPFQWVIGGFYANTDRAYQQFLPTPGYDDAIVASDFLTITGATLEGLRGGIAPPDSPFYSELFYTLEQIALFAEVSYDLSDKLQLTAGGRYYDYSEDRTASQVGIFGAGFVGQEDPTSSDGFTPRFLLRYDVNEQVTFNAQVSQGFRLGGVNDPLNVPLCTDEDEAIFGSFQDYEDETLWNYEAGVKVNTGRFSFNAAAFYTDISNLQVTLDAGSCSSRISFNVPEAHTLGLEAEFKARPTDNFELTFAGSYIESEFDSTVVDGEGNVLGGIRDGNRLASVPEFSFGSSATYFFEVSDTVEAYFSATFQHRGSIFTQPGDQEAGGVGNSILSQVSGLPFGGASGNDPTTLDLELDPYNTLNLNLGFQFPTWELVAYINNAFDENADLSFDRERGGRARLAFRTNQPRTFGITVRTNF